MFDKIPAGRKLKLNGNLRAIHVTRNEVMVKHGSRSVFSKIYADHANSNIIGPLIRLFSSPMTLDDIFGSGAIDPARRNDVVSLVSMLVEDGVLVDAEESHAQSYYRAVHGASSPLSQKHVGIVGCGQIGARVARHLGLLGIGKLTLLDDGPVPSEKDALRYLGFEIPAVEEAGTLAEALADGLGHKGQTVVSVLSGERIDEAAAAELFETCDFVVAAFDEYRLSLLHMLNKQALDADKPWVSLYVDGSEAVVGPIFVPGDTCCFNEFFQQGLAAAGLLKKEVMTHLDALESDGSHSFGRVLPPHADIAAGQLVIGIAEYLTSGRSYLVSRAIRNDFERLSIDYEDIRRLPRCPACRPFRPFRHVFL
ncbi:MAG: hypothetical protein Kow00104_10120 [Rhodothalassiaceae bacterium]